MSKKPILMEMVQRTVHAYGTDQVAEHLNKAESTTYDEVNPYPAPDRNHKLGFLDWVRILRLTRDYSSLRQVCQEFGYLLLSPPKIVVTEKDALEHLASLIKEGSDVQEALAMALVDGHLSLEERQTIRTEAWQLMEAAYALCLAMEDGE